MARLSLSTPLETQLLNRIGAISREIAKLQGERELLERSLIAARASNASLRDVTRKNSTNRIIIEQKIVTVLADRKAELSTRELYYETRKVDTFLKENTFRVHLFRLKNKGEIRSVGRGRWASPLATFPAPLSP